MGEVKSRKGGKNEREETEEIRRAWKGEKKEGMDKRKESGGKDGKSNIEFIENNSPDQLNFQPIQQPQMSSDDDLVGCQVLNVPCVLN